MPKNRALDVMGLQLSAKLIGAQSNSFRSAEKSRIKLDEDCRMRLLCLLTVLLAGLIGPLAMAAAPTLVLSAGGAVRQFTSDELLARDDAATLAVPYDPAYGRAMSYRAVPLRALLSPLPPDAGDTIQA